MPASDTLLSTHSSRPGDLNGSEPWVLPLGRASDGQRCLRDDWLFRRARAPTREVECELKGRGFTFAPNARVCVSNLRAAASLLATAPSLEGAVERSVGEVVLLVAPPGYDVSHSEPRWPETVFISVPGEEGQVGALRTLENVVHEAMHLQLTTFEGSSPLVADCDARMLSPWRREHRDLRGVLHGAYVFRCISAFFQCKALGEQLDAFGAKYTERRRREIADELRMVDYDHLSCGLTLAGRDFLDALLRDHTWGL
ncbi:HEXXH motif-containing putative peptide modification protein [uncultured Enterovirga sp.]|uniref:aKG-HExxH-type peptide beta-hydroxylase n=1 Tax=uncultured Enterovirga sp. TaxID=2026352 RepID=UPI0035CC7E8A